MITHLQTATGSFISTCSPPKNLASVICKTIPSLHPQLPLGFKQDVCVYIHCS